MICIYVLVNTYLIVIDAITYMFMDVMQMKIFHNTLSPAVLQ